MTMLLKYNKRPLSVNLHFEEKNKFLQCIALAISTVDEGVS